MDFRVRYTKARRFHRHIKECGKPKTLLVDVIKRGSHLTGDCTYTIMDLTNHLGGKHPIIDVYDALDLERFDGKIVSYARKLGYTEVSVEFKIH